MMNCVGFGGIIVLFTLVCIPSLLGNFDGVTEGDSPKVGGVRRDSIDHGGTLTLSCVRIHQSTTATRRFSLFELEERPVQCSCVPTMRHEISGV